MPGVRGVLRALPRPVERVLRPGEDGRIFYGWWIVGVSVVIQALIAAFFAQAYASYAVIFEREFGWSKTVLSLAFAMARVEGGMLGPPEGWAIDRFGPRAVTRTGLVLLGLGLLLFSRINSLPVFFAAFLLMSVGASLGGFLPLSVAVVHWFERRRATALGIMQIGFAVGGLAAPLVAWAMVTFGWRETAFTSGVLVVVIALPLVQIVRHRPQDHDLRPDGASAEEEAQRQTAAGESDDGGSPNFTAREAMRTRSFWMISLGHASALLVVGAVMVHLVLHLTDRMGYSIVQANFVFQLLAAMQIAGQLGGGYLGDRVSKRALLMVCMAGHALGILMLAFASTLWMVIGFTVLHGLAWGTRGPVVMAIRADYFGTTSFGTIMGFSGLIMTVGIVAGPVLAGVLADRTGSYQSGFTILALAAMLGSVFFLLAEKPQPPSRRPVSVERVVRPAAPPAPAGDAGSGN